MVERVKQLVEFARSTFEDFDACGPVSREEIDNAARQLDVFLPEDYVEFLNRYGTIVFRNCEIYGLVAGKGMNARVPNAFGLSKRDIADGHIPPRTLFIKAFGYGPIYLLDCSMPAPVHAVRSWDFLGQFEDQLGRFDTFSSFLEAMIQSYSRVEAVEEKGTLPGRKPQS